MDDLTGFQRDLLYAIIGLDAPSGQEIKRSLEEYYADTIRHGQLYPNLATLVDKGLITKSKQDSHSNCYHATEAGKYAIEIRRKWEDRQTSNRL